ncbi:hypothetical protein V6M85_12480 [Sulfolobus tengchongensis]|uniref:Uncharacterized protein n=1 Tax=Sulfolobus tengchongensis TaxID=207809 RepID=A0AAX4KZE3_9CREN
MDSLDDCEIDCGFVISEKKRRLLEKRLYEEIKPLLENRNVPFMKFCDILNYVCHNPNEYSCLQCYDANLMDYVTNVCATSCENKSRESFCFEIQDIYFNVIAESGDEIIIVTFYIISDPKDFKNKCNDRFIEK